MPTYQALPVKEDQLGLVVRFVGLLEERGLSAGEALLNGGAPSTNGNGRQAQPRPPLAADWTDEQIARFYRESPARLQQGLRIILEAGDEGIGTVDLAEAVQYPYGANSVAGMLGAAGRRCQNRYGKSTLPWAARWHSAHDDGTGWSILTIPEQYRPALIAVIEAHGK
jgi:hypothetical protein